MTAARPPSRPRLNRNDVVARVAAAFANEALPDVYLVGIRGYYADSIGVKGKNDRGVYDDALFLIAPGRFAAWNANTDPSKFRKGRGNGAAKGMARLKPGLYRAHQLGMHRAGTPGGHQALTQRAGPVTVIRDGVDGDYEETGWFGINIHRGGVNTTSSEGCQTVPPDQWPDVIETVRVALSAARQTVVPYVLLEEVAP